MNTRKFAEPIEWLLFTGAIEGNQLLTLHQHLNHYQQDASSDAAIQTTIDEVDPDLARQSRWEENPLDL